MPTVQKQGIQQGRVPPVAPLCPQTTGTGTAPTHASISPSHDKTCSNRYSASNAVISQPSTHSSCNQLWVGPGRRQAPTRQVHRATSSSRSPDACEMQLQERLPVLSVYLLQKRHALHRALWMCGNLPKSKLQL